MSDFPRMIYRVGGDEEIHGVMCEYMVVDSDIELDTAIVLGWSMTPTAAAEHEAQRKMIAALPLPPDVPMDAAPTRAELEQKARELGIVFDGRTTDTKLAAKVAELVKE